MGRRVYVPTAAELEGAAGPFLYELHMLREATDPFVQHSSLVHDETMRRVFLESALIHARNLLDFFTCEPTPNDDILAAHFICNSDGSPWKPTGLTHLVSRRTDINKALTHLTYTRVANKPGWPFALIRHEIEIAYLEFVERLPEDQRTSWQG